MRNRQNNHIHKGDIFMSKGHIWTMWSEEAASATDYEIVHAAGGFRVDMSGSEQYPMYRKVIKHNIKSVQKGDNKTLLEKPPYVGRIILWD